MTDDLIGKRISGYEIVTRIGQGGMATVYRAHQLSMQRDVAIKILPRQFLNDEAYKKRFNQEVKIASQLEHRNIIPVYDYGVFDEQPYIVMRYMPHGSVDDLLHQHGALPTEQILSIVEQIAPALDYAHEKQVLHRDLKPSNVLLDDHNGAFLTDFGIARLLGENASGITTQGVVGTPSYMSPEQAQGHPLDGRSDLYALGVMIFEMATGRRPFYSDTPYSIAVMQVTQAPPTPRSINPRITPSVERVIVRAMDKKRENRYPTGAALVEALRVATMSKEHDTQPSGVKINPPPQGQAPQAIIAAPQPNPQPVYASPQSPPPIMMQQPVPQQPAYSDPNVAPYTPPYPYKRRKQNDGGTWSSLAIGGAIGCGLLVVIAVIALIVISIIMSGANERGSVTDNTDLVLQDTGGEFSLPTPTQEAGEPPPTESPTEVAVLPVGQRPTNTPGVVLEDRSGTLDISDTPGSSLLYFAPRDENNYEIFTLDLNNNSETRLTERLGVDSYPQISPDGAQIVFQSDRDGDFDIYLMNMNGQNVRRLTDNAVTDRLPAWSPDGQWIIYSSDTENDGNLDLYVIRPNGDDQQIIFGNNRRNSHARWSPDGRYLVFTTGQSDTATWEIGILQMTDLIDSGDFTYLTRNTMQDSSPNFHPDGRSIIYLTMGEGRAAIGALDLDTNETRILYDGPGYEWGAHYSRDGSQIAFNTNYPSARDEVYVINVDGSDLRQVTQNGGMYPSWIP
jgi:tRNA A-37 threonylcarbamoyl transferase component Bud32